MADVTSSQQQPDATTQTPPGSHFPLLPGLRSRMVHTARVAQHIYESGPAGAETIVLIHGNASSARFFEELMVALPTYHIVAPDMRGYGASEAKVVDATRGLRDYADDVEALVETLGIERFHLLGWSLGGNIAMQYVLDHAERVRSLTLQASGSPYGFGCTHGPDGAVNYDDFAGSGGGLISPLVRERYLAKDASADSPFAPRSGMRSLYVKPSFTFDPEREDILVEQILMMAIGDTFYPGDSVPSPNWPFTGPGIYGSNNALSPKYLNQSGLADLAQKPPVLWVRGADDQVVADGSLADPGMLGKLGAIPGWPGEDVYPPQPMVTQLRAVLDHYAAQGGTYREEVLADCGHSPHIEKPEAFRAIFTAFLSQGQGSTVPDAPAPAENTPAGSLLTSSSGASSDAPAQRRSFLDILRRRR